MAASAEIFFEGLWKGNFPEFIQIRGENPFLERELRTSFKNLGFDIFREDLKTSSPNGALEDIGLATSLFQPRRVLWVQSKTGSDKWSKEGLRIWNRIVSNADPETMVLIFQITTAPSGAKKTKSKDDSPAAEFINFQAVDKTFWLEQLNLRRKKFLDPGRRGFIMNLDLDLMAMENAVELWSLGGDGWATDNLGWASKGGSSAAINPLGNSSANPSFAWVDAVLDGRESEAALLSKELLNGGGEFLMLLGLLTKSLKIWAMLEEGRVDSTQPPFLVSKLQKVRKTWQQREGNSAAALQRILHWCANSDFWIKSKPVDDESLMLRISESSRSHR